MPRSGRVSLIHLALVLFAVALIARAAHVQLWQGDDWAARARRQHYATAELPAPRGNILDARGVPLAQSREVVRLAIAPKEVRDRAALRRELVRLRVARAWIQRATDPRRSWVALPGRYLPGDAAAVTAMRGVYTTPVSERYYSQRDATRRIVGRVDRDGNALDGIELALDTVLRGRDGKASVVRDARGSRFAALSEPEIDPVPGHDVVLTINQTLQEIAEQALGDAVTRMGADGGDIVVLDPHTGELRAIASMRTAGRQSGSPALDEPFEPGSTLKPFIAAALLSRGRARADEVIGTANGQLTVEGRTITDIHRAASLSLADVIRFSSNVGIVKFAQRLSRPEQFEALRDFGFGTPTGVPFPSEAGGTLRPPAAWSRQSPASLAMGYEVSVTALQLAAAYATFANGGVLLEPTLVKEVRTADGTVRFRHSRRVVRRVVPDSVAEAVRQMLVGVVEGGTATDAGLGSFVVAGKSGTARRTARGRGYVANRYTASFVGLFPADRPQYVILVKLDNPTGTYYGGKTAAPVSRIVLEAAIAARDAALDRRALASSESLRAQPDTVRAAPRPRAAKPQLATTPYVLVLADDRETQDTASSPRPVPDVRGLPLREAVYRLHRAGFRVHLSGLGTAAVTWPRPGTLARQGSLVRMVSAP